MKTKPAFKKIIVKISGEFFGGEKHVGIDASAVMHIAREFQKALALGVECAVVVGGGNIYRGRQKGAEWLSEIAGHQMGMMATVINGKALCEAFSSLRVKSDLQCAFEISGIVRAFNASEALNKMAEKHILVFAGGTGHPFFTTDTAAVLMGLEIGAEVVMKATKVDGVYAEDPMSNPQAQRFSRLTYKDALDKNLQIMDRSAFAMAMENRMPIVIFRFEEDALQRAVCGKKAGTLVE